VGNTTTLHNVNLRAQGPPGTIAATPQKGPHMRRPFLLALTSMLLIACSDDSETPELDTTGGPDSAIVDGTPPAQETGLPDGPLITLDGPVVKSDDGVPGDGPLTPQPDAPTTNLNCQQVSTCAETCSKGCSGNFACMIKCNNDCNATGCAAAQPLFTAVNTCVQSKCLLQCLAGPSTGCANCVTSKCATEVAACNAQQC